MSSELPAPGSIMYPIMQEDKAIQKKAIAKFKFINRWIMIPLYRINLLPLFGIGKLFVLLYTIGKKSGKTRYNPLEYRIYNDKLLLFSSRGIKSDWFRNLKANPDKVILKIGFKKYHVLPRIVDSIDKKYDIIKWYCTTYPKTAKTLFGYDKNKHKLTDNIFDPIVKYIQIIEFDIHNK